MILGRQQPGIPFIFKKDWKRLFTGKNWFKWEDDRFRDRTILRRLTIPNIIAWYFMKLILKLMIILVKPIVRANERYWNYPPEEGMTYRYVSDYMWDSPIPRIKYFVIEKQININSFTGGINELSD